LRPLGRLCVCHTPDCMEPHKISASLFAGLEKAARAKSKGILLIRPAGAHADWDGGVSVSDWSMSNS